MLLQFTVENFLSFRDETRLSMVAPPGVTEHTVAVPGRPDLRVLRIAALYGANASGKSNLVGAMQVALDLIARNTPPARLPWGPFRLSADSLARPSRFQFDLVLEGSDYTYGFEVWRDRVASEWLFQGDELIFSREASDSGEPRIELGASLRQGDSEQQQFVRFVARGVPSNQLLLVEMDERHIQAIHPVRTWLREGLSTVSPHTRYRGLYEILDKNRKMRDFYGRTLRAMGTGVQEITVSSVRATGPTPEQASGEDDGTVEWGHEGGEQVRRTLSFVHEGAEPTTLEEGNESDGTRRLLHLLPILYAASLKGTKAFMVDELDRSLHTSLTRYLIEDFLRAADASASHDQLIFTTHDTNLLNGRLLTPASIWFVEKDRTGASHLHSLAEYDPAQLAVLTEHLEEGYLQGRFGAIPFLAPRDLDWRPADRREEKAS